MDANGHETARFIKPVRGLIPAEGDAYFDAMVPEALLYRVNVVSFDFVESPGK